MTEFSGLLAELPFSLAEPWVLPAMAVLVGIVVGLLVRATGAKSGRFARGATALLLAFVFFALCKYWLAAQLLNMVPADQRFEVNNPDIMISLMANEVKAAWRNAGKSVPGAARQDDPTAPVKEQYSPAIWSEAINKWEALSKSEQAARAEQHQREVNEVWALAAAQKERALDWESFQKAIVPLDGAWLAIAALLAIGIACLRPTALAPSAKGEPTARSES